MASKIPELNYVGLLQEKCMKYNTDKPEYTTEDSPLGPNSPPFTYMCRVKHLSTIGVGENKKVAKQLAAQAMIDKVKIEQVFDIKCNETNLNSVSKLNMYCVKEKKGQALYSELPEEDGEFVVSCKFEEFTAIGKGASKKIAKEKSAEAVAKHFKLYDYFEQYSKLKERNASSRNSIARLNEYCQKKKLNLIYSEGSVSNSLSKTQAYLVTCTVGDLVERSQNASKKLAKLNVASKMMRLLTETPVSSPDPASNANIGRRDPDDDNDDDQDDDIPLKRIKCDL